MNYSVRFVRLKANRHHFPFPWRLDFHLNYVDCFTLIIAKRTLFEVLTRCTYMIFTTVKILERLRLFTYTGICSGTYTYTLVMISLEIITSNVYQNVFICCSFISEILGTKSDQRQIFSICLRSNLKSSYNTCKPNSFCITGVVYSPRMIYLFWYRHVYTCNDFTWDHHVQRVPERVFFTGLQGNGKWWRFAFNLTKRTE
jgi:hypothetical protein